MDKRGNSNDQLETKRLFLVIVLWGLIPTGLELAWDVLLKYEMQLHGTDPGSMKYND